MVLARFRRSFAALRDRPTRPEARRAAASRMNATPFQARTGLADLRVARDKSRQRLATEEREFETVRRRKQLAEGISDRETVEIARVWEEHPNQCVEVVGQKIAA